MDHVTRPRPFQGRFLIYSWDLLCSTEMSTTTCNEDVKGNAKCKNSRSEPPFGVGLLRGNVCVSSIARRKARGVVDFLLVLIELFSLAITVAAL